MKDNLVIYIGRWPKSRQRFTQDTKKIYETVCWDCIHTFLWSMWVFGRSYNLWGDIRICGRLFTLNFLNR